LTAATFRDILSHYKVGFHVAEGGGVNLPESCYVFETRFDTKHSRK
jgi:hypothetical protein